MRKCENMTRSHIEKEIKFYKMMTRCHMNKYVSLLWYKWMAIGNELWKHIEFFLFLSGTSLYENKHMSYENIFIKLL